MPPRKLPKGGSSTAPPTSNGVLKDDLLSAGLHDPIAMTAVANALNRLSQNVGTSMSRAAMSARFDHDSRRDIDDECGYPKGKISPWVFQDYYQRDAIAARVVEVLPRQLWQVMPSVYEDEDPQVVTPFEKAWDELGAKIQGEHSWFKQEAGSFIFTKLREAHEKARIGNYGVVLYGFNDQTPGNEDLSLPVAGVEEDNSRSLELTDEQDDVDPDDAEAPPEDDYDETMSADDGEEEPRKRKPPTGNRKKTWKVRERKKGEPIVNGGIYRLAFNAEGEDVKKRAAGGKLELLFVKSFPETQAEISGYETNFSSPRYGQPTMYNITFNDPRYQATGVGAPSRMLAVHWTRVLHVTENGETFHPPAMEAVFNHLYNLRKAYGADGEAVWKNAVQKLFFETHPQLGGDVEVDVDGLKDEMEQFENGLQKMMVLRGMGAKAHPPALADPGPHVDVQMEAICIKLGIPVPVFKGYEIGELASTENRKDWNEQLRFWQNNMVTPCLIVPFVDRLIWLGILPKPKARPKKAPTPPRLYGTPNVPEPPPMMLAPGAGGLPPPGAEGEEGEGDASAPPGKKPFPPKFNAAPPFQKATASGAPSPDEEEDPDEEAVGDDALPQGGIEEDSALTDDLTAKQMQGQAPDDAPEEKPGYFVDWPDLDAQTDTERADIAVKMTQAIAEYIKGGCEDVVPVFDFFVKIIGWPEEEVQAMLENAEQAQLADVSMTLPGAPQQFDDEGNPIPPEEGDVQAQDQFGDVPQGAGASGEDGQAFPLEDAEEEDEAEGPPTVVRKPAAPFPKRNQLTTFNDDRRAERDVFVPPVVVQAHLATPTVNINSSTDMEPVNGAITFMAQTVNEAMMRLADAIDKLGDRPRDPPPNVVVNADDALLVQAVIEGNERLTKAVVAAIGGQQLQAREQFEAMAAEQRAAFQALQAALVAPRPFRPLRIEVGPGGHKQIVEG